MRKIIALALIAGLLTLLSSCSKPDQHLKTIPSTAQLVVSVDLFSMAQKAELYKPEQYAFFGEMMEKMKAEDPEMHEFINGLISNPLQSGVKFREDLFIFAENLDKEPTMGLTMALRNSKDFEKVVTEALAKSKMEIQLSNKDDMNCLVKNELALVFDENKALVIIRDGMKVEELLSYAQSLMSQSTDASITNHSDFAKFKADKKDFNLWLSTDFIPQNAQSMMITGQLPFKTTGNYMHMHVEFKDNGISGNTSWTYNEEIAAILNNHEFMKNEFNTKLLNYLPADDYITYGMAINPSEIYKWLYEIPTYKPMLDQANQGSPISIESIMNSIGGDIIISMHGFKLPEIDETSEYGSSNQSVMPLGTMIMSMNNEDLFKTATTQLIPPGLFQLKDGVYSGSIMGFDLFFGLFENNLIVTNDKNVIDNAGKGGLENNVGNTELKDLFSHSGFMFMNLNWDKYPESLRTMVESSMGEKELEAFQSGVRILDEVRVYNKDLTEGEFEIKMRNTENNSLHTILQVIDDNRGM